MKRLLLFCLPLFAVLMCTAPVAFGDSVNLSNGSCPANSSYNGSVTVDYSADTGDPANVGLFVVSYNSGYYMAGPTIEIGGYSGEDTADWIQYASSYIWYVVDGMDIYNDFYSGTATATTGFWGCGGPYG